MVWASAWSCRWRSWSLRRRFKYMRDVIEAGPSDETENNISLLNCPRYRYKCTLQSSSGTSLYAWKILNQQTNLIYNPSGIASNWVYIMFNSHEYFQYFNSKSWLPWLIGVYLNLIGPILNQILCTILNDGYVDYVFNRYCSGFPSQFSEWLQFFYLQLPLLMWYCNIPSSPAYWIFVSQLIW